MKAFTLSKKSWHWRLASFYGPAYEYQFVEGGDGDLCSYIRAVIKGMFIAAFITVALGLVALVEASMGAWVVYVINNGMIHMDELAVAAFIINLLCVIFGTAIFISASETGHNLRRRLNHINLTPPKDSFLMLAYRSFKEKTCIRLVVQ